MNKYIFESKRLGFRNWKSSDKIQFAAMNSNPAVMKYFPKQLTATESDNFVERIKYHFVKHGYGLWAVELKLTREFIGFIGFQNATFEADFTPCVEIGWRLDEKYWNNGYATEGAMRCLEYGFNTLKLDNIYSFTAKINTPSKNVMKKIGMKKQREFNHPKVDQNSALLEHVLYKVSRDNIDIQG
jgi:ribosomal-protein-alanine N-acetyltransferase